MLINCMTKSGMMISLLFLLLYASPKSLVLLYTVYL